MFIYDLIKIQKVLLEGELKQKPIFYVYGLLGEGDDENKDEDPEDEEEEDEDDQYYFLIAPYFSIIQSKYK